MAHVFLQDVRFALRSLRRSPVFAITAVLTLACGIGLTAAMYGVARQVLLAPLPYAEPARLVALDFGFRGESARGRQVGSAADFLERYSRSFSSFGLADGGTSGVNLSAPEAGPGHAYPVQQFRISRTFLPTLGIAPQLGRLFTAEEDALGGPRAALISDALWREKFQADLHIVGRLVRIDQEDVPVVGVLPAGAVADLQGGTRSAEPAGIFQPLQLSPKDPGYDGTNYQMIARLREGVTLAEARQELHTLLPVFAQQNPWYARWKLPSGELGELRVFPLQTALAGDLRAELLALLGAAAAVLLVACLNLAGLMVSRTAARTRELAVRSALGASRTGLARLLIAESLLLALGGSVFGFLLAHSLGQIFLAHAPLDVPDWSHGSDIAGLAAITAVLTAAATLLFGLLPIAVVLRDAILAALRNSGSQGQSMMYQRTGRILIVTQVALAFTLLTAASLLVHTFLQMRRASPGVDAAQVTIGQVTLKGDLYAHTARTVQFTERVAAQLRQTPGVQRAGAVNGLPLDRGLNMSGWPVGHKELRRTIEVRFASPGYLESIGIPVLLGRSLQPGDTASTPKVAIVSQAAAAKWWPRGDAIGSRVNVGNESEYEIVGIARDTHESSLLDRPSVLVYIPPAQISDAFTKIINNWFATTFVVRAHDGVDVAAAMRNAVSSADPELPLTKVTTMQAVVDDTVAAPKFFGWLSSSFAVFTLLLAALGLFGLLSYQVTQRTREIGVRMALGADRADVLRGFMLRGLVLTGIGLGAGLALSLLLPKLLAGVIPEFRAANAVGQQVEAGLFAVLLLFVAAAGASLLPAARAARMEPVQALRVE